MTHDSWDFESGLPDFDAVIKDAYWTTDARWVNQRTGEETALANFVWDAPSSDGGTYERSQFYPAGDGWTISNDGKTIEPAARKLNKRSTFVAFVQAAGEIYPQLKDKDVKDLSVFKGLGFRMHYQTVGRGTRDYPIPVGKAGEAQETVSTEPEIDPTTIGKLVDLAQASATHDDFMLKALEAFGEDDSLTNVIASSGAGSLYASAKAAQ